MASALSVTVSMGALTSGQFSRILRVNWVSMFTSVGNTLERAGNNKTSSNVK